MLRFRRNFFLSPDEIALILLTIVCSSLMAARILHLGLMLALTDEVAHLNFARLVFDSLTPGISQIGFWPPLLHVIMVPYVASNYLYHTGLAGLFALMPFVCAGVVAIYRLVKSLTNSRFLGIVAALSLLANPYFLYFSAVPMMEALFISNLIITAYVLLRWLQTGSLRYLVLTGFFVALTSLSRYEGLILVPLAGLIVLLQLLRKQIGRSKTEATILLFALLAILGIAFILIYSSVFSSNGNPLTFLGGTWIRDPARNLDITRFSLKETGIYLLQAAYYVLSKPLALTTLGSFLLLIVAPRNRFITVATLVILASPIVFISLSLFSGSSSIIVPNLYPFHFFHNERYTITFMGLLAAAPPLLAGALLNLQPKKGVFRTIALSIASVGLVAVLSYSAYNLYRVSFVQNFPTITENINVPSASQHDIATYLAKNYDYGKVLITRSDNDPVLHDSEVPLKNFVYEANNRYYQQVLAEPWMFARWVVMYNPSNPLPDGSETEPIGARYANNPEFNHYYTLVREDSHRRLYKINEQAVVQLAITRSYNPERIPSIVPSATTWSPSTIYADAAYSANSTSSVPLRTNRLLLERALQGYYDDHLRPEYQKGFSVDASNNGSSETQSYALLQSAYTNDPTTFDTVWTWTKKNLQRDDGLFSWQYKLNPDYTITITDKNGATDADSDIAYALLLGAKEWHNPTYEKEAQAVINGIWDHETAAENGRRHVIAGNWANNLDGLVINPSYFSPAAYREFAIADYSHDWAELITQGYQDLNTVSQNAYANRHWAFLPPNWATLNPKNGSFGSYTKKVDANDYSYDAFRTLWRVAYDYHLNQSPEAKSYLAKVDVFQKEWQKSGSICSLYLFSQAGTPCSQDKGTIAGTLATASVSNQEFAHQILDKYYLSNNALSIENERPYYEKSWYWFALYGWSQNLNLQ